MGGGPVDGKSGRRLTGFFADMPVGTKIAAALIVSMVACGAVALFGGLGLRDVDARSTEIYEENLKPVQTIARAQGLFDDTVINVTLMNIASTAEATAAKKKDLEAAAARTGDKTMVTVSGGEPSAPGR